MRLGPSPLWSNRLSTSASYTPPLVTSGTVFTLQLGEIRAIRLTNPGSVSWTTRVAGADIAGASNLVFRHGVLLLASMGSAAIRGSTGEVLWANPSPSLRYQAGYADADSVRFIVPRGDGRVVAFEITSGAELWNTPVASCAFGCALSGVSIAGDTVYATGIVKGQPGVGQEGLVIAALDRLTGTLLWSVVDSTLGGGINTPPVVAGSVLLVGSSQGWYFGAYDRFARTWSWRRRAVDGGPYQRIGVAGDTLVLTGADPVIYLLNRATGASYVEGRTRGSMYEAQFCGRYVIAMSPELRWFDKRDGRLLAARLPDDGGFTRALTVSGDTALVITSQGSVVAYPCTP